MTTDAGAPTQERGTSAVVSDEELAEIENDVRRGVGDWEEIIARLIASPRAERKARREAVAAILECNWSVSGLPDVIVLPLKAKPLTYADARSDDELEIDAALRALVALDAALAATQDAGDG